MRFGIGALALGWLCGTAAWASERTLELAGVRTTVWEPDTAVTEGLPVIIFSHGFHGCSTQSRFLMRAFAEAGYLVLAPNHRDAICNAGSGSWLQRPTQSFARPDQWTDANYRDRARDIEGIIRALGTDPQLSARVDLSRIGLAGHSLGGYTALGLAGAWPAWKLDGVRAVLALSPYSQPFIARQTLAGIAVPVMYQGGTRDFGITPALRKNSGAYQRSRPPKYYVEFQNAGHLAWTDLSAVDHEAIAAYAIAFMNHYVRGASADPLLTHATAEVAELRFSCELGASGAAGSSASRW